MDKAEETVGPTGLTRGVGFDEGANVLQVVPKVGSPVLNSSTRGGNSPASDTNSGVSASSVADSSPMRNSGHGRSGSQSPLRAQRWEQRHRGKTRERLRRKDTVKLLSVSDAVTGVCLYQRKCRWSDTQGQDSLGKLVQSFYQFARELGAGEIHFVNFEGKTKAHRRLASSRRVRAPSKATFTEAMQLLCTKNETVCCALFHDIRSATQTVTDNQPLLLHFLNSVTDAFTEAYKTQVVEIRPRLKEWSDGGRPGGREEGQGMLVDLQLPFRGFEETVDMLREACFPSTSSGPGVESPPETSPLLEGDEEGLEIGGIDPVQGQGDPPQGLGLAVS